MERSFAAMDTNIYYRMKQRMACGSILIAIACLAFSVRLFSIARWESVIHEFDPYFNYRSTKILAQEGVDRFLNWFDDRTWYPLGRYVGGTVYPGLMGSTAIMYWCLHKFNFMISIRNMCVFLAPVFSMFTSIATFLLTHEVTGRPSTALLAAFFVAIVPSYLSRSVGGSFDNEGVAIFALVMTFYLWIRAVRRGSMLMACGCAASYFFMVLSWGGFVFIINVIPLHALALLLHKGHTSKLYVAYSTFYCLGTLLSMQVPFVGFNVVRKAECAASHGVFLLLQVSAFIEWIQQFVPIKSTLFKLSGVFLIALMSTMLLVLLLSGGLQWEGRSLTLLNPTYAANFVPIIASVSEHQPTPWSAFYMDLGPLILSAPLGLFLLFEHPTEASVFMIIYGTTAWYFAGVMVRLLLTLAPAACILAAIATSQVMTKYIGLYYAQLSEQHENKMGPQPLSAPNLVASPSKEPQQLKQEYLALKSSLESIDVDEVCDLASEILNFSKLRPPIQRRNFHYLLLVIFGLSAYMAAYMFHCTFVASRVYSSPSVIFSMYDPQSKENLVYDDLRDGLFWARQNLPDDAKIMSWWDYGYQISSMANRTIIVDNNTWNNTHIATVGRAFASTEDEAAVIVQSLEVTHIFVIFGGKIGHSSDDLNKFPWFVRIASGVFPDKIIASDYQVNERFLVSNESSNAMKQSLLFKLSYYRFIEQPPKDPAMAPGYDFVRRQYIGDENITLDRFEEVFTSTNWLVRIYRFRSPNLISSMTNVHSIMTPSDLARDLGDEQ